MEPSRADLRGMNVIVTGGATEQTVKLEIAKKRIGELERENLQLRTELTRRRGDAENEKKTTEYTDYTEPGI